MSLPTAERAESPLCLLDMGAGPLSLVLRKLSLQDLCRSQLVSCEGSADRAVDLSAYSETPVPPPALAGVQGSPRCRCGFRSARLQPGSPGLLPPVLSPLLPPLLPPAPHTRAQKLWPLARAFAAAQDDSVWQSKALELYPVETVRLGEHYSTYQVRRWWWVG